MEECFVCGCGEELVLHSINIFPFVSLKRFFQGNESVTFCPSCGHLLEEEWKKKRTVKAPKGVKMSDAIVELADPLIERYPKKFHQLIDCTVKVWNLSLIDSKQEPLEKGKIIREIKKEGFDSSPFCKRSVNLLLERKKKLFPRDRRVILSYEVVEEEGGYRLTITSQGRVEEG